MNTEKLREIQNALHAEKRLRNENWALLEVLEAILEDTRNMCKCGSELKIGQSHHCNYLSGALVDLERK